ncbi:hypothetical protein [Actinomycetospora sp. CA-053990]|uniref:hypothetical protein n=1 Tax=Actinomycetospora sp. CA-053990 TaxID=3239891 RepID=UPI003D91C0B6
MVEAEDETGAVGRGHRVGERLDDAQRGAGPQGPSATSSTRSRPGVHSATAAPRTPVGSGLPPGRTTSRMRAACGCSKCAERVARDSAAEARASPCHVPTSRVMATSRSSMTSRAFHMAASALRSRPTSATRR